jgi:hypothetical protein
MLTYPVGDKIENHVFSPRFQRQVVIRSNFGGNFFLKYLVPISKKITSKIGSNYCSTIPQTVCASLPVLNTSFRTKNLWTLWGSIPRPRGFSFIANHALYH